MHYFAHNCGFSFWPLFHSVFFILSLLVFDKRISVHLRLVAYKLCILMGAWWARWRCTRTIPTVSHTTSRYIAIEQTHTKLLCLLYFNSCSRVFVCMSGCASKKNPKRFNQTKKNNKKK